MEEEVEKKQKDAAAADYDDVEQFQQEFQLSQEQKDGLSYVGENKS